MITVVLCLFVVVLFIQDYKINKLGMKLQKLAHAQELESYSIDALYEEVFPDECIGCGEILTDKDIASFFGMLDDQITPVKKAKKGLTGKK